MQAAGERFERGARQIATLGAEPPDGAKVDVSSAVLEQIQAELSFAANAATVRAADRMTKRLLDIRV